MHHTRALILVIDDDAAMCRLARALFEDEGYAVVTCDDATTALDLLSPVDGLRPDVILLDSRMPGMDGAAFARAYTTHTQHPAPIVLLSGDVRPLDAEAPWVAARVTKPFDIDRLLGVVRDLLPTTVQQSPAIE